MSADFLPNLLSEMSNWAWGPHMVILLVGTGLFLSVRLRFLQIRKLRHSIECISGKYDDPREAGDITHFQALCAALSATIGTGNIAGVATAIASGGPGAVFWMWVTAIVGMATKYTSCSLGLKYRIIHKDGSASGGPMYFLARGLGFKWLGAMFAFFAMIASFGIGDMVQANSVVEGLGFILPEKIGEVTLFSIPVYKWVVGLVLALLVGLVIIGGIRRIAKIASRIVPFMCVVYVLSALVILVIHADKIVEAFGMIFRYAFTPYAAGGGFMGVVVQQTIRYGVARGVFSNESGLGSAPMAHAAAKTREMAREGFVAMIGPFIDTIIICSMTALVIILTGVWNSGETGAALSAKAFETGLPIYGLGKFVVSFGLIFFAYSTMISWSYYGDRCSEYLFGPKAIIPYRCMFIVFVVVGAVVRLQHVWDISDIMNAFMAFPNLVALLGLSGVVRAETRSYLKRYNV